MAEISKIEWTDSTFNPVIGCQHVSPGCDHCYAEAMSNHRGWAKWGPHAERHRTSAANWRQPLQWQANAKYFQHQHKRRQRVFCASLSDWLDNQWEPEWRTELCRLIESTPDLDWLMLTKRPGNFNKLAPKSWREACPKNLWFGFTAEDDLRYRARWPIASNVPAAIHFVSYEPAIGPLLSLENDAGKVPNWIIVGGESGNGARPFYYSWAQSKIEQCKAAGISCFVKQVGSQPVNDLGKIPTREKLKDRKGVDWSEWPKQLRLRELPHAT